MQKAGDKPAFVEVAAKDTNSLVEIALIRGYQIYLSKKVAFRRSAFRRDRPGGIFRA